MLGKFAFWMAGSRVGAWIVGFVFAHLSGLLPVREVTAHAITHYGARLKAAKGFTFAFGDEKEGLYLSPSTACLHLILDEH
ncbi:MAG: hypothetical protein ACPG1C_00660 [Alphaproteobacteria bacterium]